MRYLDGPPGVCDMIRIKCPKCANPLAIPDTQAGGVGSCPKCGQKFRVPAVAAKPSDSSRPEAAARPRTDRVHEEASSRKAGPKEAALERATARAAAKTTPTNRQPAAGEPGGQGYGVGPAPETARPPRPPAKR